MKTFIYLLTIVGLIFFTQTSSLFANNCYDETSMYFSDDNDQSDCKEEAGSETWFDNTRTSHYRAPLSPVETISTISLNNSHFSVSGIIKSIAIKKKSCFFCSEAKIQSVFINKCTT